MYSGPGGAAAKSDGTLRQSLAYCGKRRRRALLATVSVTAAISPEAILQRPLPELTGVVPVSARNAQVFECSLQRCLSLRLACPELPVTTLRLSCPVARPSFQPESSGYPKMQGWLWVRPGWALCPYLWQDMLRVMYPVGHGVYKLQHRDALKVGVLLERVTPCAALLLLISLLLAELVEAQRADVRGC
ncbi:hypothetical protein U0070_016155 [Myodes glareolus]|uniref:Uncharacterized protein n=1 Tax=Myodes glareolus TaxID=447135 RepID=A0AAW0HRC2_MYOGA